MVEAQRRLYPRQRLRGSSRPGEDRPPRLVALAVARVDLKCAIDLTQPQIVALLDYIDGGQQTVGAGGSRVDRQGLLRQCLGALELVLAKLSPSRQEGGVVREAERRVGGGVIRIEVD